MPPVIFWTFVVLFGAGEGRMVSPGYDSYDACNTVRQVMEKTLLAEMRGEGTAFSVTICKQSVEYGRP